LYHLPIPEYIFRALTGGKREAIPDRLMYLIQQFEIPLWIRECFAIEFYPLQ